MRASPQREVDRELPEGVGIDLSKLSKARPAELAIRFALGAGIALVAGVVGMRFGPRLGGLFLAFPAVLPASLTLLERKDGRDKAEVDAVGAILGSCALLAFAIATAIALPRLGPPPAVGAGVLIWAAIAAALFLAVRAALIRR